MKDLETAKLAYCTNVHAGADLDSTLGNLQRHALAVKSMVSGEQPMAIGLWLSAVAARQLIEDSRSAELAEWLRDRGLVPITMNGFPFGDFHEPVVKYNVYQPSWFDTLRVNYTRDLIEILDAILPAGLEGSISTLPIAWGTPTIDPAQLAVAADNLLKISDALSALEQSTGRLIYLCLEPEPGCLLQRSDDVVDFFRDYLSLRRDFDHVRRYIRVCHDVCHAAVMFEDQSDVFERYAEAGISVGKIQVSSAIELDCRRVDPSRRVDALNQLTTFAEDRYLHQTCIRFAADERPCFFDDLPTALKETGDRNWNDSLWRTHFHVPIYLEQLGLLCTTRSEIIDCMAVASRLPQMPHLEVETYAWGVLPDELKQTELAQGIADEMKWLSNCLKFKT